eukprot:15349141-Ditylum_brightwellii.AAC.1
MHNYLQFWVEQGFKQRETTEVVVGAFWQDFLGQVVGKLVVPGMKVGSPNLQLNVETGDDLELMFDLELNIKVSCKSEGGLQYRPDIDPLHLFHRSEIITILEPCIGRQLHVVKFAQVKKEEHKQKNR